MSVSMEEVRRVAGLARLHLDEDEAGSLAGDLSRILDHVEALREAPVEEGDDDADGAGEALGLPPRVRDGEAGPDALHLPPSELAPAWRDGFYVLPRLPALDQDGGGEG